MSVDLEMLHKHHRFEDPAAGFSEEFIQVRLGLGKTVGVFTRPLGSRVSVGWVICHSFGMEQIHLARMDVIAARVLAAAGFPVLRFYGQGYGDSEHGMEVVGLSSHLAEAADAVELIREREGVEQVGILGARFGGTVAALVAAKHELPFLGMWDPIVRGKQYIRDLMRAEVLSEILETGAGGGDGHLQQLNEDLESKGWADLKGWPLSREAHESISNVDLTASLGAYQGSSLVVALSRSPKVPRAVTAMADAIVAGGGRCSVSLVQDPVALQFGQFRWRTMEGGTSKRDTQLELNERIAEATVSWAVDQMAAASLTEAPVTP
jgi:pimeloyl-ACP methyl ester carboxylesterase